MKISDFSIRRPVFTIVVMILFLILGGVSVRNIPLQLIPDINPPIGAVVTSYPNAGPEEVVEDITKPLEDSVSAIPGLKNIRSTSREGSSVVILEFSWSTSIEAVQNDLLSALRSAPLPDEAGQPSFLKFDPSQFPVMQLSLSSGGASLQKQVKEMKDELVKVEGVANVDLVGDTVQEIKIKLDETKLKDYRLTQQQIVNVIRSNNISVPGGMIEKGDKTLTTRVISKLHTTNEVSKLQVAVDREGDKVTLGDISTVEKAPQDTSVITRTNGEPAILLNIHKQADANTASVSKNFNEKLDELLREEEYKQLEKAILFDQGEYVERAVNSVLQSLVLGGALAMIVLFFFLRSFRSPLIIGISIPFSVIVTFVLLYFTDFTLNLMTLGGLALGIGMLVDNSIVVIENIYRHLSMGKTPRQAASAGTKEMAGAITASTLTTVAVFLPVIFITGLIGNLFKALAFTVSFSLFASLVVSLTVVPMVASRILKAPPENIEEKRKNSPFIRGLGRALRLTLRHRLLTLLFTVVLFAGGIFGLTTVGTQFLPPTDEGFFTVSVELEQGASLNRTKHTVENIETVLSELDVIRDHMSVIGNAREGTSAFGSSGSHTADIYVSMVNTSERDQTTLEFTEEIRDDVKEAAGAARVNFSMQSSTGSAPKTVTFSVSNNNIKELNKAIKPISERLKELHITNGLNNNREETVTEFQVIVDRGQAREHQMLPAQISSVVKNATRGTAATQIVTDTGKILTINVGYKNVDDVKALKDLLIQIPGGSYVTLDEVAKIQKGQSPVTINRLDEERAVQFDLQYAASNNLGGAAETIETEIEKLNLPTGTSVTFGGDVELLNNAMDDLILAFILAVIFVYIVMAAQFESFKYPFVIMFAIPLIAIGVSTGLTSTRTPISVTAAIGLIVLAGIVVNNAIVLVDYINRQKAQGIKSHEAIIESVKVRTRPILMTAITTILGLIPLAFGIGEGTEIQQPLAITVIGGLISSTFLTLFVIPVLYSLFDKDTRQLKKGD